MQAGAGLQIVSREPLVGQEYPPGTERITFTSAYDGATDWFCYTPGDPAQRTVVYLHGALADGAQIYTRADLRAYWLTRITSAAHPLLALNMRGTSYMNPAAAADTADILAWARRELGCGEVTLLGGSGGAFAALIYAILRPGDVQGVIALGACDIGAWYAWLAQQDEPLLQRLALSVRTAYGGTPAEQPEIYAERSLLAHADNITIPTVLTIGQRDALIPPAEARHAAAALHANPRFHFIEVLEGDHDAAVWVDIDLETCRPRG